MHDCFSLSISRSPYPRRTNIPLISPYSSLLPCTQLGPQTEAQAPQRIFLYNRQVLTGELRLPQPPRLAPTEIGVPDVESVAGASDVSALLEKASSPLLRALPDFERQFLKNLKRCLSIRRVITCHCVSTGRTAGRCTISYTHSPSVCHLIH